MRGQYWGASRDKVEIQNEERIRYTIENAVRVGVTTLHAERSWETWNEVEVQSEERICDAPKHLVTVAVTAYEGWWQVIDGARRLRSWPGLGANRGRALGGSASQGEALRREGWGYGRI